MTEKQIKAIEELTGTKKVMDQNDVYTFEFFCEHGDGIRGGMQLNIDLKDNSMNFHSYYSQAYEFQTKWLIPLGKILEGTEYDNNI